MHIKLIEPLNCLGGGGGQLLPIFIDLVSTNILLAMLGLSLSQKGMLISVLSTVGYFFKFLLLILGGGG